MLHVAESQFPNPDSHTEGGTGMSPGAHNIPKALQVLILRHENMQYTVWPLW